MIFRDNPCFPHPESTQISPVLEFICCSFCVEATRVLSFCTIGGAPTAIPRLSLLLKYEFEGKDGVCQHNYQTTFSPADSVCIDILNSMSKRKVAHTFTTQEFLEGAGVRLHRGFSYMPENLFDPFLLFDDFSSENPVDFMAGFPWHPHRGIETVTYILKGDVEHKDSIGNAGVISKGDVQWMKSGSGIIHQEMPKGSSGLVGFQLWINIPKKHKMTAPNYQEYKAKEIPEFEYANGIVARVVAGPAEQFKGPVTGDDVDPTYIDFQLKPGAELSVPVPSGYTSFIYVFDGTIQITDSAYKAGQIVLFDRIGTEVNLGAKSSGARILFVSGKPLHEPVAWHGPIVMNTREELVLAFEELNDGTFIK